MCTNRSSLLKVLAKPTEITHSLWILTCIKHWCDSSEKPQSKPQATLCHTHPKPTTLTLWIAAHLSTPALCSGELASSAHPLGHSLPFALLKGELSAVQGLVTLN